MGVKLQNIINREIIGYPQLAGNIIAVDAPNIVMALFNFARKNPDGTNAELILDRTQRPISHLYGLLYRLNFYYSKKIFPIFCFDGRDSELKRLITKDQLKDFRFTQNWYESALKSGNREKAKEIALSKEYLWQNIMLESKQLLGALGVPYIESPASAESQCAYLVKQGVATHSNSQDFDSLLFGCPSLLQNLSKSLRRKVQGKWTYNKVTPFHTNLSFFINDSGGHEVFSQIDLFKDTFAPTSGLTFSPVSGINIVNISTAFTLTADDGFGSGVSLIRYRINNSAWIDYMGRFDLSSYADGDYLIGYQAIDEMNNIETENTLVVKLVSPTSTRSSPGIPGYNLFILIGIGTFCTIILLKKKFMK